MALPALWWWRPGGLVPWGAGGMPQGVTCGDTAPSLLSVVSGGVEVMLPGVSITSPGNLFLRHSLQKSLCLSWVHSSRSEGTCWAVSPVPRAGGFCLRPGTGAWWHCATQGQGQPGMLNSLLELKTGPAALCVCRPWLSPRPRAWQDAERTRTWVSRQRDVAAGSTEIPGGRVKTQQD